MIKKCLLPVMIAVFCAAAFAQAPSRDAGRMVDTLAKAIADGQLSRRPVAVLEFRNVSPLAERNLVGQAFSALVESAVTDSLVFTLVDRRNLGKYLEEIERAMSDPTGSTKLDAGMFIEAEYFIDGSVAEEGGEFRVSARLVRTDTAEVVAESSALLPTDTLVSLGESYSYQFVAANGIGIGLRVGPTRFAALFGSEPVAVGQDLNTYVSLLGTGVSYRLSRKLKLGLGIDVDGHDVFNIQNMTFDEVQNMAYLTFDELDGMDFIDRKSGEITLLGGASVLDDGVNYTVSSITAAGSLIVSPVINLSRSFNVSVGAGPAFGVLTFTQVWDQVPMRSGNYVYMNRKEIARSTMAVGGAAEAGLEWFVLPRFALTLGARFVWVYPVGGDGTWKSLTDNESYYTSDDRSTLSFGLNPFMLPDGTPWSDTLFQTWWAYAFAGATFYF
jgi:TolB-like protein